MDQWLQTCLRNHRLQPTPQTAMELISAMDRSGVMPDSRPSDGAIVTCNLDDLGNATAHVSIGNTNLLLFHKTVVAVQVVGQKAAYNPDPLCRSSSTRSRLRNWPQSAHVTERSMSQHEFNDLIRFKPA